MTARSVKGLKLQLDLSSTMITFEIRRRFAGHFARCRRLMPETAKTYENPARGTVYRNTNGFPVPARASGIGPFLTLARIG